MLKTIRSSLRWKLLIVIISLLFTVILAVGTISFLKTSGTIREDVEQYSAQILKQANLNLARYFRENEQLFITIAGSQEFSEWSEVEAGDKYQLFMNYERIRQRFIEPYARYHPETLSIRMFNTNGNESIYRTANTTYDLILSTQYSMQQESWFDSLTQSEGIHRLVTLDAPYTNAIGRPVETPIITYVQKLKLRKEPSLLAIDISLMPTIEILRQIQLGEGGESLIIDAQGNILAHQETSFINQSIEPALLDKMNEAPNGGFYWEEQNQMIVYHQVPYTNWKVLVRVPYEDVARSIYSVRDITLIIAVASFILAAVIVYFISGSITSRLKLLQTAMRKSEEGRLSFRAQVSGSDEVAYLSNTYNRLLDTINDNIREMTELRVMQQEAVLSALQSQINSHFLYNALESINAMANIAEHKDIQRTALSLSNMLRYTSNYKAMVVTVEDELRHVENYLNIMRIIYGDAIEYNIEADASVAAVPCLKALLQPLVENSVKHGFEATGDPMRIDIEVSRISDRSIRIMIRDTGKGFTEQKLEELNKQLEMDITEEDYKKLSRIGILNVHYRLNMFYVGQKSGIRLLHNDEGSGAVIEVIIPTTTGREEGSLQ